MAIPAQQIGIYKITSPTGKIYIGQSWDIASRIRKYRSLTGSRKQTALHASINKHGWDNHNFEIITLFDNTITQECLDLSEIYYIAQYKKEGHYMLNIREGGLGGRLPKESIQKMLDTRGKWNHSEETKTKISNSHKGILHSEETKKTMLKNKNGARIVLNTESGIFYFGTEEASVAHCLNHGVLDKRFQGKLKNNTNLIQV